MNDIISLIEQMESYAKQGLPVHDIARQARIVATNLETKLETWETSMKDLLDNTKGAVRVREGGGLEDLAMSVTVTMMKLSKQSK